MTPPSEGRAQDAAIVSPAVEQEVSSRRSIVTTADKSSNNNPQKLQKRTSSRLSSSTFLDDLIPNIVADAGLNAYGCVFIEAWLLTPDGTKLTRVEPGGHWIDPSFANSLPDEELRSKALELDRYAADCPPGVGLAGTLFEQGSISLTKVVYWRQVKVMLNDPFVQRQSGDRMEQLYDIGIGLVGSVLFSFQGVSGIVIFFSRSTANMELLRSPSNERFLVGAAEHIGATYAASKNREECAAIRRQLFRQAIEKVRREIRKNKQLSLWELATDKDTLMKLKAERDAAQSPIAIEEDDMCTKMKRKIIILGKKTLTRINNSRRKWMGAKLHGPPQQSFKQCAYITFGVFFTMLTVIKIASTINSADTNFKFDSGWFSGTMCMVFALTPAPVGQPRQIFGAHLWNILVGLAIRQIPSGTSDFMEWNSLNPNSYGLPLIWKQALAVSIGVSGQAKLGLLHPPATALSFAFVSSNNYSWGTIASVILADAVVVAMAVIILNLEEKKQYPLFWLGFGWENSGGTFGAIQQKVNAVSTNLKGMRSVKGDENNV